MKKFILDLSKYEVTVPTPVTKTDEKTGKEIREFENQIQEYPLQKNLSNWLRSPGMFRSGEDIAEAVGLAKQIRDCKEDSIELDEREADVLKQVINKLVELTADTKDPNRNPNFGGPIHEEVIIRVIKMQEVK